mgnify:CR=1
MATYEEIIYDIMIGIIYLTSIITFLFASLLIVDIPFLSHIFTVLLTVTFVVLAFLFYIVCVLACLLRIGANIRSYCKAPDPIIAPPKSEIVGILLC